ncbi:hypothetical protein CSB09_02255, partial [Candidatus Gracilibacteria bacterium]
MERTRSTEHTRILGEQKRGPEISQDEKFEKLLASLQSDKFSLLDLEGILIGLADVNPSIRPYVKDYAHQNSQNIKSLLRQASQSSSISKKAAQTPESSKENHNTKDDLEGLKTELANIGLDISGISREYEQYIEHNLRSLPKESKQKIQLSLKNKLTQIQNDISQLKIQEQERYGNLDRFSENRWIIHNKIQEHLSFVNDKLLPSLEVYLKLQSGEHIPKKFQNRLDFSGGVVGRATPRNPLYIDVESYQEEIQELLGAPVDESGDFDEGFFSTQNLLDADNEVHEHLFQELGIQTKEINLLNEKDREIEEQAKLYFVAAIAVQVGGEILGGPAGMMIGAGVDLHDTFSHEETLLKIVQAAGLVDTSFRMEKTWVDNVLAGLGIFPGATQIIKGSKLAKYLDSVDPKAFKKAVERVKEVLGVSKKTNINKTNKIEKLANNELLSIIDKEFKDYTYFKDVLNKFILDDKHPMNIVNYLKNNETRDFTITQLKEILKLGEKNISQKEMVSIINAIYEGESILLKSNNIKRLEDLKNILLESNPKLFEIGGETSYEQNKILRAHAERLSSDILPSLKTKLNNVISDIPIKDGFPAINVRA